LAARSHTVRPDFTLVPAAPIWTAVVRYTPRGRSKQRAELERLPTSCTQSLVSFDDEYSLPIGSDRRAAVGDSEALQLANHAGSRMRAPRLFVQSSWEP